jgi:hypothetical protein
MFRVINVNPPATSRGQDARSTDISAYGAIRSAETRPLYEREKSGLSRMGCESLDHALIEASS